MKRVLVIYTGGTIGMLESPETGRLVPFDFSTLLKEVPELSKLDCELKTITFDEPIDSSDMNPAHWSKLVAIIEEEYDRFHGFVVLHGSDTMAYTASALSFMLEGLRKPVILTGSQLPIGALRTDARENLMTAIGIAADSVTRGGIEQPVIQEVAIYFEYHLYRGNRTHKASSEDFEAFVSPNYAPLAEAGVHLKYNTPQLARPVKQLDKSQGDLIVHHQMNTQVGSLKIFPGITPLTVDCLLQIQGLQALILETYGAGNAPNESWLTQSLKAASDRGLIIVNISQCESGSVQQGKYEVSAQLETAGVVSGHDLTFEAALTKLMFLLGQELSREQVIQEFTRSLRGELTP